MGLLLCLTVECEAKARFSIPIYLLPGRILTANYIISQHLHFLTCNLEITVTTLQNCGKDEEITHVTRSPSTVSS